MSKELLAAEISTTHYYLCEAFLTRICEDRGYETIGDIFGTGEDSVVSSLYEYAAVLQTAWEEVYKEKNAPGVFDYEVSNELACNMLIHMMKGSDELPCIKLWKKYCEALIDLWCDDTIGRFEISFDLISDKALA